MKPTIRQRLRYRFDNLMSRGTPAMISVLLVLSVAIVLIAGAILVIAGIAQMFVDNGDEDAATGYLTAVLEIYPGNETATEALIDMGIDPPPAE